MGKTLEETRKYKREWAKQNYAKNTPSAQKQKEFTRLANERRKANKVYIRKQDLTGDRFGKLTVIEFIDFQNKSARWKCKCDCGNEVIVKRKYLTLGQTKSCGCLEKGMQSGHGDTKGGKHTKEYMAWGQMKSRCYNTNTKGYENYGGRGIIVCDRWLYSYDNFLLDMGRAPSSKHSLDRFPNNDGNYEPGNCRWATRKQQSNNKRNNIIVEYDGHKMTIGEWAEKLGIVNGSYFNRMITKKGKTIEEILNKSKIKRTLEPVCPE